MEYETLIRKGNPTPGDVHVNTALTNFSEAYVQAEQRFVAGVAFPTLPVQKQSDYYFTFSRADFFRNTAQQRAPTARAAESGFRVTSAGNYFCNVWAMAKLVSDEERANADAAIRPDEDATDYVTQQLLIAREVEFATNFMATSKWTTDITGVSGTPSSGQVKQWNDSTATPIEDIWEGKATILQRTGLPANTLVVGYPVWKELVNHSQTVDRVKAGQTPGAPAVLTRQWLAQILELDRVLVMEAAYNTAIEEATASYSFIGNKVALLCHTAPRPGLRTPSAGYNVVWTGYQGASANGIRILRYREDARHSDVIEGESAFSLKLISADLGYFWTSIVA